METEQKILSFEDANDLFYLETPDVNTPLNSDQVFHLQESRDQRTKLIQLYFQFIKRINQELSGVDDEGLKKVKVIGGDLVANTLLEMNGGAKFCCDPSLEIDVDSEEEFAPFLFYMAVGQIDSDDSEILTVIQVIDGVTYEPTLLIESQDPSIEEYFLADDVGRVSEQNEQILAKLEALLSFEDPYYEVKIEVIED